MKPEEINEIWQKCQRNDRKAQASVYQYFAGKMLAVCMRYAKDRSEAEDMLQTGFIKVFTKASMFENKGSLEGWIRRIMVNSAIELYRKNKMAFVSTDEIQEVHISGNEQSALNSLGYHDLLNLVQELPLGYRTVFNMYAIEGYSHQEIAEMLSISEGNSKSQLSRARGWLRDRIQKMEELGI